MYRGINPKVGVLLHIKGVGMKQTLDVADDRMIKILEHLFYREKITVDSTEEDVIAAVSAYLMPAIEAHWSSTPKTTRRYERVCADGGRIMFEYPRVPIIAHEKPEERVAKVLNKKDGCYRAIVRHLPTALKKTYSDQTEMQLKVIANELKE